VGTDPHQSWKITPDPNNAGYYNIQNKYLLDNNVTYSALSINGQDPNYTSVKPFWAISDVSQAWQLTPVSQSC